ncbi:MAG: CdaR family protein [bacterium]|nr:CdaR family protein [bacterium]
MERKINLLAFFTKDLNIKLLALAVAVGLWATLSFLGNHTVTIDNITPDIVNIPTGLGLGENLPKVTVQLRAPLTNNAVTSQDKNQLVRAFIDLSGSGIGERTVSVSVTTSIPNATIISVVPNSITVALDPSVEREVPVRVIPEGSPAEGYQLGIIQPTPQLVKVRAALGLFQTLSAGIDAKINVAGIKEAFEGDAYLVLPTGVQSGVDRVRVKIAVEQTQISKNLGIRVKTQGTPQNGYFVRGITTTPVTIEVTGDRNLVDPLTLVDTEPINIDGAISARDGDLKPTLPNGVKLSSGETTIRARVDIAPLEDTKEISAPISIKDLPDGLRASTVNPTSLKVSLRGKNVSNLQNNDAKIYISASGKNDGTFSVQPQVSDIVTPDQTTAVAVEQKSVNITLERY